MADRETVKIKAMVVVDEDGAWVAIGWANDEGTPETDVEVLKRVIGPPEGDVHATYWVTAVLMVPAMDEIEAKVTEADD